MLIKGKFLRANDRIRAAKVLLIDENGTSLGVQSLFFALTKAKEAGLDLVEVSPEIFPPVCRIMDFGKYKYEQEKKERENRQKSKTLELKEIRLSPTIGDHDLQVKAEKAKELLEKGHKIMLSMRLRGRENIFVGRAIEIVKSFADQVGMALSEEPKKIGNQIRVLLVAKKEDKNISEEKNIIRESQDEAKNPQN